VPSPADLPTQSLGVATVIIAYRADLELLRRLIAAVQPQVGALWLINNGDVGELAALDVSHDLEIIQSEHNLGIGAAISHAIHLAKIAGYEFLLTLDQDSIPAPNMVDTLLTSHRELIKRGALVAGVGPKQVDRRSAHQSLFIAPITRSFPLRQYFTPSSGDVIEADHLITSGMLAPLSIYAVIGAPRADLFIDYVDIEWSLRARKHGMKLFVVGSAVLHHSIGDNYRHFMGKQVPIHSPLRNYYLMRNGVFLQKLPTISLVWKISDALQLVKKFIFFGFFLPQRATRWRMMLRGIHDGLRGKLGIYQERP